MLSEGCTLTEQGEQNLRTLTAGDQSYDAIKAALVKLSTSGSKLLSKGKDVFLESHSGASSSTVNPVGSTASSSTLLADSDSEPESLDSEGERMILAEINRMNLTEDALHPIFAVTKAIKLNRKKTWAENKALKRAIIKDRGHFDKDTRPPRVPRSQYIKNDKKKRLSIDQLKKVTKCNNCLQKGHWAKECTNPKIETGWRSYGLQTSL